MNRKVRFHNIILIQRLPLQQVRVHFSWADFDRDDCFKGISRLMYTCSFLTPFTCKSCWSYLLHWNVGHHFKLIFCMYHVQFKTINQVLDYFLALTPVLKTMQSQIFVWTVFGGVVIS